MKTYVRLFYKREQEYKKGKMVDLAEPILVPGLGTFNTQRLDGRESMDNQIYDSIKIMESRNADGFKIIWTNNLQDNGDAIYEHPSPYKYSKEN